jgi:EAL domain-containing protein (putative c-di-GMP-specific phosphodiesterase class I)
MLSLIDTELATDLQLAIQRNELFLAYQPKIDLATGELAGVEALARWNHPRHGAIEPAAFVQAAERFGLIDSLTEWVLLDMLRQWVCWSEQGLRMNVAINVSALCLRDVWLPDYLHRCCQREGVPAECITVEVTEGATQHVVRLLDTLTRIRLKGMEVALDDFGTGFSSLLQLRQLPYSELKIDKCFVRDAAVSQECRVIVKAVVDLAHGLGLRTTAEGVEDLKTFALLKEFGCDLAQGFVIARPLEGSGLAEWILKQAPQWRAHCQHPPANLRVVSSNGHEPQRLGASKRTKDPAPPLAVVSRGSGSDRP